MWMNLVFQITGRSHLWSLYLRVFGRSLWRRATIINLLSVLLINSLKHLWSCSSPEEFFFLFISSTVHIFHIFRFYPIQFHNLWQLYLIEFLMLLIGQGLPELQHLVWWRLLTWFGRFVLFTNLRLKKISVGVFGLLSFYPNNRRHWLVLYWKYLKEYPVYA